MPSGCWDPLETQGEIAQVGSWIDDLPSMMENAEDPKSRPPGSPAEGGSEVVYYDDDDMSTLLLPSPLDSMGISDETQSTVSHKPGDPCSCNACKADSLLEFVGRKCLISGFRPPLPFWVEEIDGQKYCACDCKACQAFCLLEWVGKRCQRTGMYPPRAVEAANRKPQWRDTAKVRWSLVKLKVTGKLFRKQACDLSKATCID